ncbi:hypothetical protein C8R47DRAFT_1107367 [Mycena vitilis]|nr:hypothetical protein C8R47DRAFT_1107367 [Mycena vitilis]
MTLGRPSWMRFSAPKPRFPAEMMERVLEAQEQQFAKYRKRLDQIHRNEKFKKEHPELFDQYGERILELGVLPGHVCSPWFPPSGSDMLRADDEESTQEVLVPPSRWHTIPDSPVSIVHGLDGLSELHEMFVSIPPATITKIVGHEFKPMDLATLNPKRCWDKFERGCSLRDYPSLQSLLVPLCMYFSILVAGVSATSWDLEMTSIVGQCGLKYTSHLVELAELYHWPAVVQYHLHFHSKRRQEMIRDEYSQWMVEDTELVKQHLDGQMRRLRSGKRWGVSSSGGSAKSCPKRM